ncbi:dnc [Symbiodinium sp. CCMP2456]|nr:dnc [Symbiodinium sp. CCMP2456]
MQIFDAVEHMAIYFVKDYSNQQNTQTEAEDAVKNRFSREVRLLAKVLKKLDLLTLIANAKRPVDEFEQLGDGPCAFLPDYATYAAARHQRTLPRSDSEAEREENELPVLMESIGQELGPAEISRNDFFSWDFNIAELNIGQRASLARCLVTMFDTSPGFNERQAVSLTRYTCHCEFVKELEHQFRDEEEVPFHNWIHAVDVAFSLHIVFHVTSAANFLALHERHALMLAALAHDVGHFGVNNSFLCDSSHELALLYNDQSCLQNMSCAKLFRLASSPETAIFNNFDEPTRRDVRQVIVSAILHCDPACHESLMAHMLRHYEIQQDLFEYIHQLLREHDEEKQEVLAKANAEVEEYFWNADVKYTLRNFLLHFTDNSYSLKTWEICSTWAARVSEEFFKQADRERICKMPIGPLNDRARVNVPFVQVTFIKHLVAPQAILIVKMLPSMRGCTRSMWHNLQRWASKWERSGPDHDEMQRVRREITQLHWEANEEEEAVEAVKTEQEVRFEKMLLQFLNLVWKLLIVVIDCSYGPRLSNPPRSIRALKAKLAAALGIEALSKQSGTGGAEAASAQAIVSGVEGPQRHLIEQDDDLCGFWDRVATNPGVSEADAEEVRRISKSLTVPTSSLPGTMQHTWGSSHVQPTRSNSRSSQQPLVSLPGMVLAKQAAGTLMQSSTPQRHGDHRASCLPTIDTSALDAQIKQLEERCEDAEVKLATSQQQLESASAELEVLEMELKVARDANQASEEKISQLEDLSAQLQEQNLGFIKTFEEQLEHARKDIRQEVTDQYQGALDNQAKKLHEAESHVRRLEGQLRVTLDKIKDLEAGVRQERSNARRSEAALAGEHAKIEEMSSKLHWQAARLRQLEFYANTWQRKVHELAESNAIRVLTEPANMHSFRVSNFSEKMRWPKGRMVQSPEFNIPELGETQLEFFPAGEINSRPGWCSVRLRVPDGSRMRWRVTVGNKEFDPREDHYDARQWWNRYGIQCLNFCQADDLLAEVMPESDSVVLGVQVLEIFSTAVVPAAPVVPVEVDREEAKPARPGTAPQRHVESPRRPSNASQVPPPTISSIKDAPVARSQPQLPKPAYAFAAGTASAAAAAAAFVVKSGNLPPAVAASRGLHRQRSFGALRANKVL